MARTAAYRWQNERKRGLLGKGPKPKSRPKRTRGITNKQASYLAALERQLGVPYSGNGMNTREASSAIDKAKRLLKDATPAGTGATKRKGASSIPGKPIG